MKLQRRYIIVAIAFVVALLTLGNLAGGEKKAKEPEKKKEPAKPVVVDGELLNGDLKDKVQQNSLCKTYTFQMEKGKSYQIDLTSTAFRPYLRLLNADGNQVAVDFDQFGNQGPASIIHRSSKTEDYEIVCTTINPNTPGKFTLVVKEMTGDEGKPIELKLEKGTVQYKGMLAKGDPKYMGKFQRSSSSISKRARITRSITWRPQFDAYLYLIGPDGTVLAQDDDGGEGLNSRIIHAANKAGEYRIIATSLGGRSFGQFTFQVAERK